MSDNPQAALRRLLDTINTIQLASITPEGAPNISYAPYVRDEDGNYYIFISRLASHTRDLLTSAPVAVMLSEDEATVRQIFARTRVTYQCQVEQVLPADSAYSVMLDALEKKFGNILAVLRNLPDFILFRLVPESGRFVMGFGQAYDLAGEGLQTLKHVG